MRSSHSQPYFVSTAIGLAVAALAMSATPTLAQTAPADTQAASEPEAMVGEIVVTAQKRAERLQDVPLAVTAVAGDMLERRQINDSSSLTQAVPSLTFQQGANPSNTTFRVRGVGTALFSQGVESAVSVVVDGVVAARSAQGFADFADIERVEVLRGPQGTLFGRNATAGVINVVTARPSNSFGGRVDATVAEGDEYRIKGTVSGPITDDLRARLTGYYNDVGGHIHNVSTGRDVNGYKSYGLRGKVEWNATSNLRFLLSADYRNNESDCCASVLISAVNPVIAQLSAPLVASRQNRQLNEDVETFANSRQNTVSLQADWDLGRATLTSISAYQKYWLNVNQPIDRIDSDPVVFVGSGAAYAAWPVNGGSVDLGNFTQEVRLSSNGSDRLTYVVGAYYSDLEIDRDFRRRRALCATGAIGQTCASPVYQSSKSSARLKGESSALFGQVEYQIVGGLKLIGGLRAQYEEISVAGSRTSPWLTGDVLLTGNAPVSGKREASDSAVTGKAGLQYMFSRNSQVYGSYTRGYKGLGFDTEISANFATQDPVQPETVNAYELGYKGRTADGVFSLSAAAFLADYKNLQVQANRSDPTTGITQFVTTNAGSSRTKGVELEGTFRPDEHFSLNVSVTYAKATVDIDGLNCPLQQQAAAVTYASNFPTNTCYKRSSVVNGATVVSGALQDVSGGSLPASPKLRVNIAPRYEHPLPGGGFVGFIQGAVSYQSAQNFSLEQDPLLEQKAYALVDLSLGVRQIDDRYTVTVFVKNLFDKNYMTSIGHNSLLATAANPYDLVATVNKDADRYFGATIGLKF